MYKKVFLIEKLKQYFLWGGLAVLTIPTVPIRAVEILNDAVDSVKKLLNPEQQSHENKNRKCSSCAGTDKVFIKSDHPLHQWADDHARKEGLRGVHLFYNAHDKDTPVINAQVDFEGRYASIHFLGNPEIEDHEYIKAIISHELGHFKAGKKSRFFEIARDTTSVYGQMAEFSVAGALIMPHLPASFPTGPFSVSNFLMASAASMAAIQITSDIARRFNHSVEHLADMKSAELVGPKAAIETLSTLEDRYNQAVLDHGGPHICAHSTRSRSIAESWLRFRGKLTGQLYQTHPKHDLRIDFIRNACGINSTEVLPQSAAPETVKVNNPRSKSHP